MYRPKKKKSCFNIQPVTELLLTPVSNSSPVLAFTCSAGADDCVSSSAVALPSKPGLILAKHSRQPSSLPAPLCCSFLSSSQITSAFPATQLSGPIPKFPLQTKYAGDRHYHLLPRDPKPPHSTLCFKPSLKAVSEALPTFPHAPSAQPCSTSKHQNHVSCFSLELKLVF